MSASAEGNQNTEPQVVPNKPESKQTQNTSQNDGQQANEVPEMTANHYHVRIKGLRERGHRLRSDIDQPSLSRKPTWFDEDLFKNASSVYERHFMGVNFAHLSGLLLLVRVDSVYRTLSATGQSETVAKLFRRYYHTVKHVKTWYEGDIFEDDSDAQRSFLIVRGMHNKVCTKFNDADKKSSDRLEANRETVSETSKLIGETLVDDNKSIHISQYDIMLTQYAFVGFIVTKAEKVGLIDDFSERDLQSVLHFWRVIGYYLGAQDDLNLCAHEVKDIVRLCDAITEIEFNTAIKTNNIASPPGIMSLNIVRSVKFIPMLTIYGILRYLYELLGIELTEIEHKRNWYSSLSYTLIKLVMSNLLAYWPFRSFNNGLTRLSVHLVGKVEDWFAGRLDSKYGQTLSA